MDWTTTVRSRSPNRCAASSRARRTSSTWTIRSKSASKKLTLVVDRAKAARLGVAQSSIATALATVLDGEDMSYLHGANVKYAVPIRVEYSEADKADLEQVLALRVRSEGGQLVPLSEILEVVDGSREHSIYHKDLLPVVYVTGDMAGATRQPALRTVRDGRDPEQGHGAGAMVSAGARQPL